jgi:hypothetical protein
MAYTEGTSHVRRRFSVAREAKVSDVIYDPHQGPGLGDQFIVVENVLVAAWLRFHGEEQVDRVVFPDGVMGSVFQRTDHAIAALREWTAPSGIASDLRRYANLVEVEDQVHTLLERDERQRKTLDDPRSRGE